VTPNATHRPVACATQRDFVPGIAALDQQHPNMRLGFPAGQPYICSVHENSTLNQTFNMEPFMSLRLPLYDGDSFLRAGPQWRETSPAGTMTTDSTPEIVHRVTSGDAQIARLDPFTIEAKARALRAQEISRLLKSFVRFLGTRIEHARRRREESRLAGAQSIGEIENRLRESEQSKLVRA
jgi:hypothetical protein